MLGFHTLTFGTSGTSQLSALHAGLTLSSKKFLGTHFCLKLSGTQGEWRDRPLENFKGPYHESNPEPIVLWRSATTNWWDNVKCQNHMEYFQNLLCYFTSYLLLCVLWFAYWKLPVVSQYQFFFNFTRHR